MAVCRTGEVQVDRARREVGVAHEAFDLTHPSGESSQPTVRAQLLLRAGVWRRHTERAKSKHASFVRRIRVLASRSATPLVPARKMCALVVDASPMPGREQADR